MVIPITTLWLPIFVAAVLVLGASSIIHTVLPYHRSDVRRVREEESVVATLRPFDLGSRLIQWFSYSLLVGALAAYLGGRLLSPGEDYAPVFRVTGTVAFACYSMAPMQRSIWHGQTWTTTLKSMLEGLVYAALTAGAFAWLWPA